MLGETIQNLKNLHDKLSKANDFFKLSCLFDICDELQKNIELLEKKQQSLKGASIINIDDERIK